MSAAKKLELTPDEIFLQDALRDGRAIKTEISMKALGKPDVALQARVNHLDMTHVHRLGMSLENQGYLAPVVVFRDEAGKLRLADGFHRHECYRKAGRTSIPAYQVEGGHREALEFATMCNRENCLGRTKEDEKKAAFMLFAEEAWWNCTGGRIAEHIGVTRGTISKWRTEYAAANTIELPTLIERADGKKVAPKWLKNGEHRIRCRQHKGRMSYSAYVFGKNEYLGTNADDSRARLDQILSKGAAPRVKLQPKAMRVWLARRGIHVVPAGDRHAGFGYVNLYGECVIASGESNSTGAIDGLVGRVLLARQKHCPAGRAIISCYDLPSCEIIDIAKQLGIEFMTPEELVESLKG